MNARCVAIAFTLAGPWAFSSTACAAGPLPLTASGQENEMRHALRGEIVKVIPERESLLVAHEEIPGVMKAMTMMFRVDIALIAGAKPGTHIVAYMVRRDNAWWLEDVVVLPESK